MNKLTALLALISIEGLGSVGVKRLVDCFGSAQSAVNARNSDLRRIGGLSVSMAVAVSRLDGRQFEGKPEELADSGISLVDLWDSRYPVTLSRIHNPPVLLFIRGKILEKDSRAVAIVGTRRPSQYGRQIAARIAEELALNGITVISGLARGIDSHAHHGALKAGGRTIAVLGSGIDVIYPPENCELYRRIGENGAVITEYPPGTEPASFTFPQRNRIISGLALGTLVVEAGDRSGALITAGYALEQGKEVFAVPGPVSSPVSRGPNGLIKSGAKLVEGVQDILDEFPLITPEKREKPEPRLAEDEQKVYERLSNEPVHIDVISSVTGLSSSETMAILLKMELRQIVRQHSGMRYTR